MGKRKRLKYSGEKEKRPDEEYGLHRIPTGPFLL